MTFHKSSRSNQVPSRQHLVIAAIHAGRWIRRIEFTALRSPRLAAIPLAYRQIGFQAFKVFASCIIALYVVLLTLMTIVVWVMAVLPVPRSNDEPDIFQVSHPQHRVKHPEMYDENGDLL
ncbi:hypothetical protein LZ023_20680 [Pseudomonas silvicola]|nr:hypothetical protein LZ023_20680 [Pseudomonas silvicola]